MNSRLLQTREVLSYRDMPVRVIAYAQTFLVSKILIAPKLMDTYTFFGPLEAHQAFTEQKKMLGTKTDLV